MEIKQIEEMNREEEKVKLSIEPKKKKKKNNMVNCSNYENKENLLKLERI